MNVTYTEHSPCLSVELQSSLEVHDRMANKREVNYGLEYIISLHKTNKTRCLHLVIAGSHGYLACQSFELHAFPCRDDLIRLD